jgi:[protein-PII] uridylyltransferase
MVKIAHQRQIIDRGALSSAIDELAYDAAPDSMDLRQAVLALVKATLGAGRDELRQRLEAGGSGNECVQAGSFLVDQIIRVLYDFVTGTVYRATNPTSSERLSLVAVGGYGRGELAPQSDVDILFLLPYKQTPWGEQVVEYMLYMLWDLGLKVGHATRSCDECLRLSREDLTIRTAILDARYLWGDQELFLELRQRFGTELVAGTGPEFVEAKLGERDERHVRMGDSRYVLEPNIKEGKGGLRDLQTLFWIGKYVYQVDHLEDLVERGVFTRAEYRRFEKAEEFLRNIRCHLHILAGRPEERLTYDKQPLLAERLNYTDHAGTLGVERFMKHYFLIAKTVGDLTRIFCAAIEEQHKRKKRIRFPRFGLLSRQVEGFRVDGDRLNFLDPGDVKADPVNLIRIFQVAHDRQLDIHPHALRQITRDLKLMNQDLRENPEANAAFMELLAHKRDPEIALRRMNEAAVLGRFIPDFGRVVAQMQHDMYHVYTVDEHTIRAIGVLAKIESGEFAADHPLSVEILPKIKMRRVLYVAVLLHDIAKGRGGDHSILGADVAADLCPRLGLDATETETVAWLVRHHLAMSNTAFKRDLGDPKTIADFVELVQNTERLRLLVLLTVADIRAVGPGVWNGWKGQLLRDLYHRAEEELIGSQDHESTRARAGHVKDDLRDRLADWPTADIDAHLAKGHTAFWLSGDLDTHERWARMMRDADKDEHPLKISFRAMEFEAVTEVTVYAADHPGLFTRLAGAMTLSGANIVDARIHTTSDGMALDVFWLQDLQDEAITRKDHLDRIAATVERVMHGELKVRRALAQRRDTRPKRAHVFTVEPLIILDNDASNTHTVIEVTGRDRPALLHDLTRALFDLSLTVSHARIATYGERAVDVFYVKDLFGLKITSEAKLTQIRERMRMALSGETAEGPGRNQEKVAASAGGT